jgi:hypothetical protein
MLPPAAAAMNPCGQLALWNAVKASTAPSCGSAGCACSPPRAATSHSGRGLHTNTPLYCDTRAAGPEAAASGTWSAGVTRPSKRTRRRGGALLGTGVMSGAGGGAAEGLRCACSAASNGWRRKPSGAPGRGARNACVQSATQQCGRRCGGWRELEGSV